MEASCTKPNRTTKCRVFIAPAGVNLARAKNPDIAPQIWVSPLETLDLPNAYFDAICLWDVIEHIWNPRMVADHLLCALKPGGLLLLSTPNIDTVIARLMVTLGIFFDTAGASQFFQSGEHPPLLSTNSKPSLSLGFAGKTGKPWLYPVQTAASFPTASGIYSAAV